MTRRFVVGTSGFRYQSWRGTFYPSGLRQKDELAFASRHFDSIELNGTFYSLLRPATFRAFREATPEGFVFAVKGSRFISHMKKLRDVDAALANFFAQGLLELGTRLGPILWQFPASMPCDLERFGAFFAMLPRSHGEAARLARRHDARLEGRASTAAHVDAPLRYAVEVRDAAFFEPPFRALLAKHDLALVISDGAGRWPTAVTTDGSFAYVRLHGSEELYVSGYRDDELDRWAATCRRLARGGREVFVYFDNDAKVHAPADARGLLDRLGVAPPRHPLPALTGRRRAPAGPDRIGARASDDPRWQLARRAR